MTTIPASIPEAFEHSVERFPERVAVATAVEELTYAQLAARAEYFARWLRVRGIRRGHNVGLFAQRSVDTIAAMLGILKAGAAFVPFDVSYPTKLLRQIYEDSRPVAMLVHDSLLEGPNVFWQGEVLNLGAHADPNEPGASFSRPSISSDDAAYIMYTSGSTGQPKGVVVPHRGVVRLVIDTDFATLGPDEVILQLAPLSFDASTFEIWGALLNGGKLALASNPQPSLDEIGDEIARHGVTTAWFTAALFHLMVDHNLSGLRPLRQLLAGGDVLSPTHVAKALRALPDCRLINGYGPTENTTFSCCYNIPRDYDGRSPVPIGRAIRRTETSILDDELCVGGMGLALGYLNRPELTAERFVPHPITGDTIYKTGDRVRMRPDGNLEFLGRVDRQVKIDGKRVELDEIESHLRATGLVLDAAVVCPPGEAGRRVIHAFVTAAAGTTVDIEGLRHRLREELPEFMVPGSITRLDSFPLSPAGKVDRARLPIAAPDAVSGAAGRPPANAIEAALKTIWERVLNRDNVGLDENFFDLGGTSLGLIEVHSLISRSMASDLRVVEMFQYPRISALAERLAQPGGTARIAAAPTQGPGSGFVAIVGLAGRFPGARTIEEFWSNLRSGVESISRFSEAELEDSFGDEVRRAPNFVKARPILTAVDEFDAEFFGMYAREAELTDPQQRVFLECAWEALESAGCDPRSYPGSIGVFAGCSINTYFLEHVCRDRKTLEEFTSSYQVGCYPMLLGAGLDFLATRVSYKLNLRGPSVNVQSACSTSLLAVAQACQSLLLRQSDMALAGGVSITFPQKRGYQHLEGGMVSRDGTCRTFDASSTGTIFGSGAGVVALKRLEDAERDADHVFAVIRGCGINNDGAAKVGFTAPSIDGQAAAIAAAHANARIDARSVGYVECHGTATPLGDPIEIAALTKAFGASTTDRQFCAVGSVKSNIGHLDAAAGVVGLIKTALALEHELIPASLHFQTPNPQIDFGATPFYVNSKLTEWPRGAVTRRAGVSAFGLGGTNVHVVLEEAPAVPAPRLAQERPGMAEELLIVSARSDAAVAAARANLATFLQRNPEQSLADVAFTLRAGRRAFERRSFVVARSAAEAVEQLGKPAPVVAARGTQPTVAFLFPGQGSQYPGMARDLYDTDAEFRRHFEQCSAICRPLIAADLAGLIYPQSNDAAASDRLMNTQYAQPAIFTIEYSLARLWMSWGVQPSAMIGHSIGEFVAAVLAGVMALEDALPLVALRGRLMQALDRGSMLSVRLPENELRSLLVPEVSIAAVNAPSLTVASGPDAAIDLLEHTLQSRGAVCRRLHTSHAFHSSMVDPIVEPLRERLSQLRLSPPSIPCISCVAGTWISDTQATSPGYWAQHARETVRFAEGARSLGAQLLLEVGPGNVLSTLARQSLQSPVVITSLPDSARAVSDRASMLDALGRLWSHGVEPDWNAVHTPGARKVPTLPTYPFERKRYWIDSPRKLRATTRASSELVPQDEKAMTQNTNTRILELSTAIAGILENLSGTAPPSLTEPLSFLEMGYDSLFLTQVAQKIQSQMKVKITFRALLAQYPNIPALAGFLAEQIPAPAAPAPAAPAIAPAPLVISPAAPALASVTAMSTGTATASGANPAAVGALEGIFRDQLNTLSQLMARQFELLQTMGAAAAPTLPAAASPVVASVPAAGPVPTAGPVPASVAQASASAQPRATAESNTAADAPSRFAVFNPKQTVAAHVTTAEQQLHIADLSARYNQRTAGSKRYTQAHRDVLADPRAASGFRRELKELVYPIVTDRCKGSKIWDVDGNEYVDLVNGFGQTAFGHSPEFVVRAVNDQLERGFAIGPQAELAGKVARLFCDMTGNDRMTFCNTGSEAVMAAIRIARTVTGREKIVIFNGDYHGQFDEVLVKGVQKAGAAPRSMPIAPGIPSSAVQNMVVLEYATPESLQWIRDNAADLAAVIVEPVQSRHPNLQPFEFLREIRKITAASGTAFVLDEVVTGFRTHPGGMQAIIGIRADLATYGKVVGGGLPIGILAGTRRFMDALDGGMWQFGDDSIPEAGVTFFAGTFVRHPLALAAAHAVLQHLQTEGPQLQEKLAARTANLATNLNELFTRYQINTRVETFASWFFFNIHNEHPLASLLFYHLRLRGVHIQDGFPCFLTTAHSDADIDVIYDAFAQSIAELSAVGILGKIPSGESASGIALTESQTEIWLAAQMSDTASCAFNESVSLRMQGSLNQAALRSALSRVYERHDALRTAFTATGEAMRIAPAKPVELPLLDLSGHADRDRRLARLVAEDARTPFDLVSGHATRARLIRLATDQHVLLFTGHHIVLDGWSINVIVSELAEIYRAECAGDVPELQPALPFSSYALAQANRSPQEVAASERYWLDQYREPVTALNLPTDRPRPAFKSYAGASRCRRIDAALYQSLKKSAARSGNTLFVTLLGAFQALIGRLCGQREVVVGVPTAGQAQIEEQVLVGHCVNFLPIRNSWSAQTTIAEHLRTLAQQVLDAYEHQSYTLGTLVRKLELTRQANRVPLAEIQFNLERLAEHLELPGLRLEVTPNSKAAVNFDLFLNVIESEAGLRLDCDYNTDLFDAGTVDLWLECYQSVLESILSDPAQRVASMAYLPEAQRRQLLVDYNQTAAPFPDRCIHQLFERQVVERPRAVAARAGADSVSYETLNRRANQLANVLLQRIGAARSGGQHRVGIAIERSIDMLVALLAALKAGCAYVPLDPGHPTGRLRHILNDAKVAALITDGSVDPSVVPGGTISIHIKRELGEIAAAPPGPLNITVTNDALAYVIYTSGSTGLPKGVEVTHSAVVNFLTSMAREPGMSSDDVLLAVTTISFDIAGLELYLPLVTGARVHIANSDEVGDGFALLANIEKGGVTVLQATPATWRMLLEAGFRAGTGFKMLCGGEALPRELANRLLESDGVLWNMYGPTETTIWSSCARISAGTDPVAVGRPISNTQFYVLDSNGQPTIAGTPGELYIGGAGVARGYCNRPELTAERFLTNPFQSGRVYRTGDLAKWLPDGQLQVLSRIDQQIKLRGFRIELGEIEATLMRQNELAAAAVLLREDAPGAPRLVVYYVESVGHSRTAARMRETLAAELPDYMIPTGWMKLERLPLSPNGKLDRAALPAPELLAPDEAEFVAPSSITEVRLAKIWADVLHLARVGANMDLLKLGADSIQLFQIVARSSREGMHLSAKELLQLRTVRAVAARIDESSSRMESQARGSLPSLSQFQRSRRSGSAPGS